MTTTAANQISIVTTGNTTVDWGDGTTSNITGTNKTTSHRYSAAGAYTVVVTGTPTAFKVSALVAYITELHSISLRSITSYEYAFSEASNMSGDLSTMTFPSNLTDASNMFKDCTRLTGSIPSLPRSLQDGQEMFSGTSQLSGTCPTKPSSLNKYTNMYKNSGVTCDYGQ